MFNIVRETVIVRRWYSEIYLFAVAPVTDESKSPKVRNIPRRESSFFEEEPFGNWNKMSCTQKNDTSARYTVTVKLVNSRSQNSQPTNNNIINNNSLVWNNNGRQQQKFLSTTTARTKEQLTITSSSLSGTPSSCSVTIPLTAVTRQVPCVTFD